MLHTLNFFILNWNVLCVLLNFLISFEWSYDFISKVPIFNLLHSDTILQKEKCSKKKTGYTVPPLQINYAYLYNVKMHYIICIWCSISESIQDLNFRLGIQAKVQRGPRLMRIHLVLNSTSANFGKTPKIFT